jgi:hypothetical protein
MARPPGRDLPARLQPGCVIPGITPKKNTTMVNYEILKKASLAIKVDFSNKLLVI